MRRRALFITSLLASLSFIGLVGCEDEKESTGDTVVCAEGTELFEGTCRPAANLCPDGQVYSDGECRAEQGGGDGLECGAGTVPNAAGTACVPDPDDQLECGNGTIEQNGRCVPDPNAQVECGPGTIEEDGECVAINPCDEGEVFDGMRCIDPPTCQAGTIEDANGDCVPVDPTEDVEVAETDENNDPLIGGGTPVVFTLGAQGAAVVLGGVIEAPRDIVVEGADETPALEPDFDGFVFAGGKGQRIAIEGTAVGAPDVAWGLYYAGDDAAEVPYQRFAVPTTSGNTRREYVLPKDGAYLIRVSTFNNVQLETFGAGISWNGDADASYVLAVTPLAPVAPETETTAAFSWSGDAAGLAALPHLQVDAAAGTVLDLSFTVDSGLVLGEALLTSPDFSAFYGFLAPGVTRVTVPEGGLLITADYTVSYEVAPSFTITSLPVPITGIPDLNGGPVEGELASSGGLEWYRVEVDAPTVIHAEVAPGEGSRASVGVVVADAEFNALGAGSGPAPDFGVGNASVDVFLAAPGTYYIAVVDLGRPGSFDGAYTFTLTTSATTVPAFGGEAGALTYGAPLTQAADVAAGDAWFYLDLAQGGDLAITGTPDAVDIALEIFGEGQIAERGAFAPAASADEGAAAEIETLADRTPAGFALVRVRNTALGGGNGDPVGTLTLTAELGDPLEGAVREVEPNDTQAGAQVLEVAPALDAPVTVAGDLEVNDAGAYNDFFTFTVENPALVSLSTMPGLVGGADTTLTLFNAGGAELAFNDDGAGLGVYSSLSGVAVPAGTYTVQVGVYEGFFGPTIGGDYLLTIQIDEEFSVCAPGFTACNAGMLDVCNADGDAFDSQPCLQGCEVVEGVGALCAADVELDVNNNDQWQGADVLAINVDGRYEVDGTIGLGDDQGFTDLVDWYSFEQTVAGFVNISFVANPRGPQGFLPDYVEVYAADDLTTPLAAAQYDYFADVPPTLEGLWLPAGATYFIKVGSVGGFFGAFGGYRLVIEHIATICEPGVGVCADASVFEACSADGQDSVMVTCAFGCGDVGGADGCIALLEEEPNNTAVEAQQIGEIALGSTGAIEGEVLSTDVSDSDWYRFTLTEGAVVTLETSPSQLSPATFDTEIWLYDGMEALLANDDDGGENFYSLIGPVFLAPGDYFVKVEHYSTTSLVSGPYRLNITAEAALCTFGASMCAEGGELAVCNGLEFEVVETCFFGCDDDMAGNAACAGDPAEPNDDDLTATPITAPASVDGVMEAGDVDWFALTVTDDDVMAGISYNLAVTPVGFDSQLYICSESDVASLCNYDENSAVGDQGFDDEEDSIAGFTPASAGTYYIIVNSWFGGTGSYTLTVE